VAVKFLGIREGSEDEPWTIRLVPNQEQQPELVRDDDVADESVEKPPPRPNKGD
jgi:hypothetical protein